MDIKKVLEKLCLSCGVAGEEENASQTAAELLGEFGEVKVDSFGNVYGIIGKHNDDRKTIMLDAHIDEIGMLVTYITDEGFLKVSNCGGLDNRVLLAQQVTVYGNEKVTGFVTSTPPHLEKDNKSVPDVDDIFIDVGMTKEQAEKIISYGDRVLIENRLEQLQGSLVTSKALDDRSGVAAILLALEMLKDKSTKYNVSVLFSSQEETGERGAKTGAYVLNPDMAIAVDVSFGKAHGENEEDCGEIGKGAMIGFAPGLSKEMSQGLVDAALKNRLPYQLEVMNANTGTNADKIGLSRGGVKTVTLSIPLRHMHTPVEIVDLKDIENTALLMAKFIESEEC